MVVKQFTPHLFHFDTDDAAIAATAASHLNPRNYDGGTDDYETYRDHHHEYLPYVQPGRVRDKFDTDRTSTQVTLIQPEMEWLRRGLLEMAKMAMDDTEDGNWGLDYALAELQIVTEFNNALDHTPPTGAWQRFDQLADDTDYEYDYTPPIDQ